MGSEPGILDRQRELYGEPLADVTGRITKALGITQGQLAAILGLSAPMLSQLLSGHRTKIGNPAVLHRLQALAELETQAAGLSAVELAARVAEIREATPTITGRVGTEAVAVLAGLRLAAPGPELARLAGLTTSATLADLLRRAAVVDG